jgi:hypothetical protein
MTALPWYSVASVGGQPIALHLLKGAKAARIDPIRRAMAQEESMIKKTAYPTIIQGGMGVGVSGWRLARAVSRLGQLGVVSGTALDQVFARRLQDGDPGGHMRYGLDHFPFHEMAERVWSAYFIPGGKQDYESYKKLPMHDLSGPRELQELCIVSNFARWTRQPGWDQLSGKNPTASAAVDLWRDAGRRRLRADGRRHPSKNSRGAGRSGAA